MSELRDTEKKLAVIWKSVFCISEEELQNLDRQSDFFTHTKCFNEKVRPTEANDSSALNEAEIFVKGCVREILTSSVNSEFDIWSDGIADYRTLGEQAVFIDCCIAIASKSDRPQKMQYDLKALQASLSEMPLPPIFWFEEPDSKT